MSENLQNIPVFLPIYRAESTVSKKGRNGRTEMVEMCSRKVGGKTQTKFLEYDESIKEELGIMYIGTKIR
jgi:hypothetical protein